MNWFSKFIFAVIILSYSALVNSQVIRTIERELAYEIGRVDLKSGITNKQADEIAEYYCQNYISGCGYAYPSIESKYAWEAIPRSGVSGTPDPSPIRIAKHTGLISWGESAAVRLVDIIEKNETAPIPTNKNKCKNTNSYEKPSDVTTKVQFVLLPSGATADIKFKLSSKNIKCDMAFRQMVEKWRFPSRDRQIALVASANACCN